MDNRLMKIDEFWEKMKLKDVDAKSTIEVSEKVIKIIRKIVKSRDELGLSQRDLAKKCGMKQSALARIETFKIIPKISTLIKIADCVNVKIEAYDKNETEYISGVMQLGVIMCNGINYNTQIGGNYEYGKTY